MSTIEKFEAGLLIDKHDLDDEVIRQPSTFYEVCKLYMDAISTRDEMLMRIKEVEADVDDTIRKQFELEGDKKPTEKAIEKMIRTDERVAKAKRRALRATNEAAKLESLRDSYKMRSHALHELVELYKVNYMITESEGETRKPDKVDRKRRRE